MSNFKPILFSTEMVQAILEGRKTQTRRVVKNIDNSSEYLRDLSGMLGFPFIEPKEFEKPDHEKLASVLQCPYGTVGDILWVRETFCEPNLLDGYEDNFYYKADNIEKIDFRYRFFAGVKWRPSIYMPKEACRLFLKIKDIRVERLQQISEQQAISEGIEKINDNELLAYRSYAIAKEKCTGVFPITSFRTLWQKINGEESWYANQWVWVIEFEKIDRPYNFLDEKLKKVWNYNGRNIK